MYINHQTIYIYIFTVGFSGSLSLMSNIYVPVLLLFVSFVLNVGESSTSFNVLDGGEYQIHATARGQERG